MLPRFWNSASIIIIPKIKLLSNAIILFEKGKDDGLVMDDHLEKPGNYARSLFVDFSSALNTIMPDLLSDKLTQLSVPTSICQWITSFLTDKHQLVRLGKLTSRTLTISTGDPQGCVLSLLLFSLYTNDCTSKDPSVKLLNLWQHYSHRPHQGWRRVCLQTGG